MKHLYARRIFLRNLVVAASAAAMGLPLYGCGGPRMQALAAGAKLKVVFFIVPDGLAVDSWTGGGFGDGLGLWHPTANAGDSTDFQLRDVSAELTAHRAKSLYLRGVMLGEGNSGHNGWNVLLRDRAAQLPSIDVVLGRDPAMTGLNPAFRSLFSGPHAGIDGSPWFVSWTNAGAIRTPERDPVLLHEAIFGLPSRAVRAAQTRGKHIFEPALADIRELRERLSGAQRQKLDTQLDSIEQVMADMDDELPHPGECSVDTAPEAHPIASAEFRTRVQAAHERVVANALACGITRVATIQIARSAEQLNILDVTSAKNPHDCAHRYAGEEEWSGTRKWYARRAKLFMDELARYDDPDVDGDKLIDHTLVVVTSEMADGAPEHQIDMPLLLMGGASGLLRNGSGNGRYFSIAPQADRDHHTGNPVIGKRFVDMPRIWNTVAAACGVEPPYPGGVVTGIFNNVG